MRRLAARVGHIRPFMVMELLERARRLEAQGRSVIHMEIGEPDFPTPRSIVEAGMEAIASGRVAYTTAAGLWPLRRAIAEYYQRRYHVAVAPERIFLTPGASGAFLLLLALVLEPGGQVLMTDPGYPGNGNFVRLFEGEPVQIPVDGSSNYHLTAESVCNHWQLTTQGVWVTSPANPTGTVIDPQILAAIAKEVERRGGFLLSDETYHGLEYGRRCASALEFSDTAFVVNSFSKYFGMTGWRLGWLIVPDAFVDAATRLIQNIFIAAPTPAQQAALAAFRPETLVELEKRRLQFEARGKFLYHALSDLGFVIDTRPQGAFYLYADCSRFTDDSRKFAMELLEQAGVAVTPGCDFGLARASQYVRFAYTTNMAKLQEGVHKIAAFTSQIVGI